MIDKISKLNNEFYKSFPEVYLKPSKVNKFLRNHSNEVEKKIIKRFLDLDLDKNFVIYANGGFGRKEIFPISDIDISIVEKNKSNIECISFNTKEMIAKKLVEKITNELKANG